MKERPRAESVFLYFPAAGIRMRVGPWRINAIAALKKGCEHPFQLACAATWIPYFLMRFQTVTRLTPRMRAASD